MSKHTPGPWEIEEPLDHELTIVEAGKATHEWRFIASIMLPDKKPERLDIPASEARANARLIAAAPDLLADLRSAITYMRDAIDAVRRYDGPAMAEQYALRAQEIEATIARASGSEGTP